MTSRRFPFFAGASTFSYLCSFPPYGCRLTSIGRRRQTQRKTAAALDQLKPQTFCLHKSWGFGRDNSWNLLLNQIVVDFDAKKNHSMQLQYAAETLQPLPDTHIFVRKVKEPDVLRDLRRPTMSLRLVELVLESFGGKATQEQLQRALSPEIVSEGDFKRVVGSRQESHYGKMAASPYLPERPNRSRCAMDRVSFVDEADQFVSECAND